MEMLWFPEAASWRTVFEREVVKFPNTTHDDQVDALAYAVQVYKSLPSWVSKPREPETDGEIMAAHHKKIASENKRKKFQHTVHTRPYR